MIRRATFDDLADLTAMAAEMHREAPQYRDIPFVENDLRDHLQSMIETMQMSGMACVFVDEKDGAIRGMIGGIMVPFMFNWRQSYACDFGFFVRRQYRGGGAAFALLRAYEGWARSNRASRIRIGESTGTNPSRFDELMKKTGYKVSATAYERED